MQNDILKDAKLAIERESVNPILALKLAQAVIELSEKLKNQSDAYHTMAELYEHRCLLYINLCLAHSSKSFWKEDYEGWFCLYLETDSGQISYHCPNSMLPLIKNIQKDPDHKFDGHKSDDVVFRLRNEALAKIRGETKTKS